MTCVRLGAPARRGTTFIAIVVATALTSGGVQALTAKPKPPTSAGKPDAGGGGPNLSAQYGIWGAYTASSNGKKVCFALAKPSSTKANPPNRPRDPSFAFISTRPAEKVVNEVSVMIGYQIKPGTDSTLEVGGARFPMYAQGDGLWIKNAAEEERLVEALRKGADAVVKATSAKGTETTDVFSLKGLAQALDRVAQDCAAEPDSSSRLRNR